MTRDISIPRDRDIRVPDISLAHQLYEQHRRLVGLGQSGVYQDVVALIEMLKDGKRLSYNADDEFFRKLRIDQGAAIFNAFPVANVTLGQFMGNVPEVPHCLRKRDSDRAIWVLVDPRVSIRLAALWLKVRLNQKADGTYAHVKPERSTPYWTRFYYGAASSSMRTERFTESLAHDLRPARVLEGLFALLHDPRTLRERSQYCMRLAGDRLRGNGPATIPHLYINGKEGINLGVSNGEASSIAGHAFVQD